MYGCLGVCGGGGGVGEVCVSVGGKGVDFDVDKCVGMQPCSFISKSINYMIKRIVADGWLELKFPVTEDGQKVISVVQTLRNTWTHLLETKLKASQSKNRTHIACTWSMVSHCVMETAYCNE